MEQDIQKSASGHRGDLLRSGTGDVGEVHCVICVLREGEASPPAAMLATALAEVRCTGAFLLACHVRVRDLSHYGRVDMLAPASAMSEFADYVLGLNQEEAEEAFAPLRKAAQAAGVPLQILSVEGEKGLKKLLQQYEPASVHQQ